MGSERNDLEMTNLSVVEMMLYTLSVLVYWSHLPTPKSLLAPRFFTSIHSHTQTQFFDKRCEETCIAQACIGGNDPFLRARRINVPCEVYGGVT